MSVEQVTVLLLAAILVAVAVTHEWLELRRKFMGLDAQYDAEAASNSHLRAALGESREGCMTERAQHQSAMLEKIDSHRREMDGMVAGLHQACDEAITLKAELKVKDEQLERVTRAWEDLLRRNDRPLETDPAAIEKPAGCPICQSGDLAIMHALWRVSQDPAVDPVRSGHRLGCVNCLTEWSLGHNAVTFNLRPGPGVVDTAAKEKANLGAVGLTPEEKVAGMAQRRAPRTDLRFRKPPGKRAAPIEDDEEDA